MMWPKSDKSDFGWGGESAGGVARLSTGRDRQVVADHQSCRHQGGVSCNRWSDRGLPCAAKTARYIVHKQSQSTGVTFMRSTTFTVRVDTVAKKRLEKLARSTGRSRSFLAAEAINEYLDVNEWQVTGIKRAIASFDRGQGVRHVRVKAWVTSWGSRRERPVPKPS
jgi:RHH-type transcriptional regulator, rel operon repressor / antitoxin RelB